MVADLLECRELAFTVAQLAEEAPRALALSLGRRTVERPASVEHDERPSPTVARLDEAGFRGVELGVGALVLLDGPFRQPQGLGQRFVGRDQGAVVAGLRARLVHSDLIGARAALP